MDKESLVELTPKYKKANLRKEFKNHLEDGLADTGASVTCGGAHLLDLLGIKREELIQSKVVIRAANGQKLTLLGVVPVWIKVKTGGEPQREILHITKELKKD